MMKDFNFLLSKRSYTLIAIGFALVLIGFLLMVGDNPDPNTFNQNVYDFQRITLAPMLVIAGFIVEFVAIFKK